MIKKGNINFDLAVQRGMVWDIYRKSLLIHSILQGFPIPAIYLTKENGVYSALDGKQRCNTIADYISNKFALSLKTPDVKLEDGTFEEIAGKKFSDLSDELQDEIKDFSLTIYYYENITEEEINEMFFRINNGKPLSATELTRVKAKDLKSFQNIASHNMIKASVSEKGKERYNDEQIAQYEAEKEKIINEAKTKLYTYLAVLEIGLIAVYLCVVPLQKKAILKYSV